MTAKLIRDQSGGTYRSRCWCCQFWAGGGPGFFRASGECRRDPPQNGTHPVTRYLDRCSGWEPDNDLLARLLAPLQYMGMSAIESHGQEQFEYEVAFRFKDEERWIKSEP